MKGSAKTAGEPPLAWVVALWEWIVDHTVVVVLSAPLASSPSLLLVRVARVPRRERLKVVPVCATEAGCGCRTCRTASTIAAIVRVPVHDAVRLVAAS